MQAQSSATSILPTIHFQTAEVSGASATRVIQVCSRQHRRIRSVSQETRLLRDALRLKQRMSDLPQDVFDKRLKYIHQRLAKLAGATYETHDCQRLAKRLSKHAHQLFTFLEQMDVEPDNNRAERAIRPAVVTRKISGGNRSPKGTEALGIITRPIPHLHQLDKSQGYKQLPMIFMQSITNTSTSANALQTSASTRTITILPLIVKTKIRHF